MPSSNWILHRSVAWLLWLAIFVHLYNIQTYFLSHFPLQNSTSYLAKQLSWKLGLCIYWVSDIYEYPSHSTMQAVNVISCCIPFLSGQCAPSWFICIYGQWHLSIWLVWKLGEWPEPFTFHVISLAIKFHTHRSPLFPTASIITALHNAWLGTLIEWYIEQDGGWGNGWKWSTANRQWMQSTSQNISTPHRPT